MPPSPRPLGVTLLALLFLFGFLASGVSSISLLTPGSALESIWRLNPRAHEILSLMPVAAGIFLACVSMACAMAAYGLLTGKRWGYRLSVALLVVNAAGDLVNAIRGTEPLAWFGVPIVGAILWYLASVPVRNYFAAYGRRRDHFEPNR